ncbi:hypothetical protein MFMK1_003575 [Metallumcola ferriviriculae]|uniref:PAS domain-containing protein n=1 Tax=Metallumcola ferriviriculae TaxID=3039180 RepID=A0AAU0UTX8_9FIRM|nr:hypothetical protein MFMK1_003575 [Desulfitibacteraceae bacterium MK1]
MINDIHELKEKIYHLEKRIIELEMENEQLKVEKSSHDDEFKIEEIINNIDEMLFLSEVNSNGEPGCFKKVNNKAVEKLGYSKEELLELTPLHLIEKSMQDEKIFE